MIALIVNGERYEVDVPSDMPLLWVLRDVLRMTGTKFGCGMALCGACTVHVDGVVYGEITLKSGRVEQSNFHDYQALRINQVPQIEVHLIRSGEAPGGLGEAGTTSAVPALRNAIYAATGVALRRMPIDRRLLAS